MRTLNFYDEIGLLEPAFIDYNGYRYCEEKHFTWIKQFWQPTKEKYIGLGKLYVENEEFKKYFDNYADGLAKFLAKAMKIYANKN